MRFEEGLVSVVMPAFNAEATIAESIQSVMAQTYPNWELLVVDDGSTDSTAAVAREYCARDARIRVLRTGKSLGKPFYPRNIGIESAAGRFIAFLDSDDIWMPQKLEHQLPQFADSSAAIVFSDYYKFFSDSEKARRVIKAPKRVVYKSALYGNPIGNLTAVYDTQKTGKVLFEDAGHEDYIFWLAILRMGFCAVNTRTVEAGYRVSKSSVSADKKKAASWVWNIYRNVLHMGCLRASFCFSAYAIKGALKYISNEGGGIDNI